MARAGDRRDHPVLRGRERARGQRAEPGRLSPGEQALCFWFAMSLVGFAVLWRWDLLGAAISIAGGAGFFLTELALSGQFPSGWALPMFFAPGALVLLGRWLERPRPAV